MIVCSCSRITDRDIHVAIDWMRAADPYALITPGKVYRALGKRPDCGGCIRLFIANMRASGALEVRNDRAGEVPGELRNLRLAARDDG